MVEMGWWWTPSYLGYLSRTWDSAPSAGVFSGPPRAYHRRSAAGHPATSCLTLLNPSSDLGAYYMRSNGGTECTSGSSRKVIGRPRHGSEIFPLPAQAITAWSDTVEAVAADAEVA